jgi:putative peptidoglycan lipid II flippase
LVSALTMLSRVFGLVREQLLAALLATGPESEAYQIAFRIPNLLRDLFAEGSLSAAFIPTFARVYKQRSPEAAFELGRRVMGVLMLVVGALTIAAYVGTVPLVEQLAPGFAKVAGKTELAISLTRVMLPFLLVVSLAAVAMGMLNAQGIYGPPAFAPTAFNWVAIATGLGLVAMHASPEQTAWGWSWGVLVGGIAQLVVQLPRLRKQGFHFGLSFTIDDDVKHMLRLMAPAALGLAATQVNIVVNSRFASAYPGAVASLNYAFRLLYLPIGVFGVAIATISTASLSRKAAEGDEYGVRQTVRQALGLVAFLTLPSSVGLWVLARPIIAMIYQRRAFTSADTQAVAAATAVYSIGLFAYSAVKVLAPVYYARGRTRVPLLASACAVAANIATSYWLRGRFGFLAMALGTSVAAWMNVFILFQLLPKPTETHSDEGQAQRALWASFVKTVVASAAMGGFGYALLAALPPWPGQMARIAVGLGSTALCGAVFVFCAWALRIPEAQLFTGALKRRFARS